MLNQRSRSTTTGQSHNKRSNTCASKKFVIELILKKKNFMTVFFISLRVLTNRRKLLLQIQLKTACSDSTCFEHAVSEFEPEALQMSMSC